ncbi:MAG: DUF4143 domain-containing protein [Bacteroidales bacterium]|nr:DUF4143 domain-containing protein [Bacteroidales bacterium]
MRWKSYIKDSLIETGISRDIIQITRIDKPAVMKNLFELGCTYSGQILSMTKILGQLQDAGNTTTLSHYLHLLETAGMLSGIQKYAVAPLRRRASIPKFQVHNNALLTAQTEILKKEIPNHPALWGRIIESCIGGYLINQSIRSSFDVYYWRERDKEVDFVLKYGDKMIAIEVKSQANSGPYNGMDTFRKVFNPVKTYSIDNQHLSWKEFLRIDPLQLF